MKVDYSVSHHTHTAPISSQYPQDSRLGGPQGQSRCPHQAVNPASPVTQSTPYTEVMPDVMTIFIIIMYHCVITKLKGVFCFENFLSFGCSNFIMKSDLKCYQSYFH
jgi:hypothetical protein